MMVILGQRDPNSIVSTDKPVKNTVDRHCEVRRISVAIIQTVCGHITDISSNIQPDTSLLVINKIISKLTGFPRDALIAVMLQEGTSDAILEAMRGTYGLLCQQHAIGIISVVSLKEGARVWRRTLGVKEVLESVAIILGGTEETSTPKVIQLVRYMSIAAMNLRILPSLFSPAPLF